MKLFFREFGRGEPLILLHGLFGSSDNWVTFARKLSADINRRILVPDLRNHGQSPHHSVFSFDAMVDDLHELMQDYQIDRPAIMGHSLGGKIILKSLEEAPNNFSKIIIADMGLRKYSPRYGHVEVLELMQKNDLSEYTSRNEVEEFVSKNIIDQRIQSVVMKNVYWKTKEMLGWKINVEAISDYLPEIFLGIAYPKPIDTPITFIKGGNSDYINSEDVGLIAKNFSHSVIVEIENAGHWLHVDNPEAFYNAVKIALIE